MAENTPLFKNKIVILVITLGLILRVFFSFSTYHPDLRTFQYAGQIIAEGNLLNFYDFLQDLPESEDLKRLVVFNYPPAIYFFHGLFNFIFSFLFGSSLVNGYLVEIKEGLGKFDFMFHLSLIKIPYLIFDLLVAFILVRFFERTNEKVIAITLWMFNPVVIYSAYILSQFDIIPTFFVLLALFFVNKKKLEIASLSLGAGIAFKLFPIFLLIPLCFLGKKFSDKVKIFAIGLIPYIVSVVPYIFSPGFRTTALVASQTDKSFYANIPVSGGLNIILFPLTLAVVYLVLYYKKNVENSYSNLRRSFLVVLLSFFIFTHVHPQWFLWVTPLLIMEFIKSGKKYRAIFLSLVGYFFIYLFLYEDPSLTIGALAPLFPSLYNTKNMWEILGINIDYIYLRSFFHSLFVAASVFLGVKYLLTEKYE